MNIFTIIFLLIAIICVVALFLVIVYNRYQELILRINEAEGYIDDTLRTRFDLINRSISIIKAHIKTDKDPFESIVKLRSRKITNFEMDRKINESLDEFYMIKEKNPSLMESDSFKKICSDLNKSEETLKAYRSYYNGFILKYNKMVRIFPFNIVGLMLNYKEKTLYDGKNMNDDIFDDFKI